MQVNTLRQRHFTQDIRAMGEEPSEVCISAVRITGAHHLSDAVHRELRAATVDSQNARQGRHDWPDSTSASTIGPYAEFLHWYAGPLRALSEYGSAHRICRIPLVGVMFNDKPSIDNRSHGMVMLLRIVRVKGMCHIDGDDEGVPQVAHEGAVCRRPVEPLMYGLQRVHKHRGPGTLGRARANLLVVEQHHHSDVSDSIHRCIDQRANTLVGAA